jgi:acetolactate synthase regulatory subunit
MSINWADYHTFYGTGESIPRLLRGISSGDSKQAMASLNKLMDLVEHQDNVLAVTVKVVPALANIATQCSPDVAIEILRFFEHLARIWATSRDQRLLSDRSQFTNEASSIDNGITADHIETYEAIRANAEILLMLLKNPNAPVRRASMSVITLLAEDAPNLMGSLLDAFESERDTETSAAFCRYMANMFFSSTLVPVAVPKESTTRYVALTTKMISEFPSAELPSISRAMGLAIVLRHDARDEVERVLGQILHRGAPWPTLPWNYDFLFDACNCLLKLGSDRSIPVLRDNVCLASDVHDVHIVVRALLSAVLENSIDFRWAIVGWGFSTEANGDQLYKYVRNVVSNPMEVLRPEQTSAIAAIANCGRFWEVKSNLLSAFGLPDARTELGELLDKSR